MVTYIINRRDYLNRLSGPTVNHYLEEGDMELFNSVQSAVLNGNLTFDNIVEGLIEESAKLFTLTQDEEGNDVKLPVTPRDLFSMRFQIIAEREFENLNYNLTNDRLNLWFEDWRSDEGVQFYNEQDHKMILDIFKRIHTQIGRPSDTYLADWVACEISTGGYLVKEMIVDYEGWEFEKTTTAESYRFI